jgi:hypothetical protein
VRVELAGGERHQNQAHARLARRLADRVGDRLLVLGHVVEDAVRLHVLELDPGGPAELADRAGLVAEVVLQLAGRHVHHPAAEAHEVRQRRVGADGDPVGEG